LFPDELQAGGMEGATMYSRRVGRAGWGGPGGAGRGWKKKDGGQMGR
jgi:hypothetical protein